MISIRDDIVQWLKDELKIEGIDINIEKSYNNKRYKNFPLVIVTETRNKSLNQICSTEYVSDLGYQIDIYSPSKNINDKVISGETIVREIAFKIDEILSNKWFTREESPLDNISNLDSTINRFVLIYSVLVDKNNYIYRR